MRRDVSVKGRVEPGKIEEVATFPVRAGTNPSLRDVACYQMAGSALGLIDNGELQPPPLLLPDRWNCNSPNLWHAVDAATQVHTHSRT